MKRNLCIAACVKKRTTLYVQKKIQGTLYANGYKIKRRNIARNTVSMDNCIWFYIFDSEDPLWTPWKLIRNKPNLWMIHKASRGALALSERYNARVCRDTIDSTAIANIPSKIIIRFFFFFFFKLERCQWSCSRDVVYIQNDPIASYCAPSHCRFKLSSRTCYWVMHSRTYWNFISNLFSHTNVFFILFVNHWDQMQRENCDYFACVCRSR